MLQRAISVGCGVGLLGLTVGAGAHQIDQGVFKGVVVLDQGLIERGILLRDKALIIGQHLVQRGLLRLDLLDELDHGGVIRRHDVGQRQKMDVHHRAPDFLQPSFADHILVHNGFRVGMDVIDAEHRQNVGQKCHQSKQNNGQN